MTAKLIKLILFEKDCACFIGVLGYSKEGLFRSKYNLIKD